MLPSGPAVRPAPLIGAFEHGVGPYLSAGGERIEQRRLLADFVALHYKRNDQNFVRGTVRVRGDTVEVFPSHFSGHQERILHGRALR